MLHAISGLYSKEIAKAKVTYAKAFKVVRLKGQPKECLTDTINKVLTVGVYDLVIFYAYLGHALGSYAIGVLLIDIILLGRSRQDNRVYRAKLLSYRKGL